MTIEALGQSAKTINVRRRRAHVDRRALTVEQVKVETLATEIQTGVQHRSGPPFCVRALLS
jgi:hypothetical protein